MYYVDDVSITHHIPARYVNEDTSKLYCGFYVEIIDLTEYMTGVEIETMEKQEE